MGARSPFDLVVTDLDNTLYDWEAFFVPSFRAMLAEVQRISGLGRSDLEASFRRVYQAHRTTEYAFVIEELDVLRAVEPGLDPAAIRDKYSSAIEAFRRTRSSTLTLYPSVRKTLHTLNAAGIPVAAHSDSLMGYVSARLRQLDVDGLIAAVSAPQDHGRPPHLVARSGPSVGPGSQIQQLEYDPSVRKPDTRTLQRIVETFAVAPARTIYVGDNLTKDIAMAERAGFASAWARYGTVHDPGLRKQLLAITYWTDSDVEEEARLRADGALLRPTFELGAFSDLLGIMGLA